MHHLKAIDKFNLKLQSKNATVVSKLAICCPVWPWNSTDGIDKTIGHIFYATSSFLHHFVATGEFKVELHVVWERPIGSNSTFFCRVTLKFDGWHWKTNRASLLSNIKLYALFHHLMWIQSAVTVRKLLSWVFTSDLDLWPWPFAWTSLW